MAVYMFIGGYVPPVAEKKYKIDITDFVIENTYSELSGAWVGGLSKDGTQYFISQNNGTIRKYVLEHPFDFSSYISYQDLTSSGQIHQIYINEDGTKLAYASYSSFVGIYDLTTPYDLTTATNHKTVSCANPVGIWFRPDGMRYYIGYYSNEGIKQYDLSTPWDITTGTYSGQLATGTERGVTLSPDGVWLIKTDSSNTANHTTIQYRLTTPRDITTAVAFRTISHQYYAMSAISLDGKYMYAGNNYVAEFPEYISDEIYYNNNNYLEYQDLVNKIGSVQYVDSGSRFRFKNAVYIGNRTALDFNGTTMKTVNLDTLTCTETTLSKSIPSRCRYFGEDRILTPVGLMKFDGTFVSDFSYTSITPGVNGVVWANIDYTVYKGIVAGDSITFTQVGSAGNDQFVGRMQYGHLGAYLVNSDDTSGNNVSTFVNVNNNDAISGFGGGSASRGREAYAGPDGNIYRRCLRNNGWGRFQKIGTDHIDWIGESLSTDWTAWGDRHGHILGNFVCGGMNSNNGTGTGYGDRSYYIGTDGSVTTVQSNCRGYDTSIQGNYGFIDEKGRLYPGTGGGGSGIIFKTDKIFTDLNWKNPYLYR